MTSSSCSVVLLQTAGSNQLMALIAYTSNYIYMCKLTSTGLLLATSNVIPTLATAPVVGAALTNGDFVFTYGVSSVQSTKIYRYGTSPLAILGVAQNNTNNGGIVYTRF